MGKRKIILLLTIIVLLGLLFGGGCGIELTGLFDSGWQAWSDWTRKVNFSTVGFSKGGEKLYFAKAFTYYRSRDYYDMEDKTTSNDIRFRKSSLYEIDINTKSVREITKIVTEESYQGSSTNESTIKTFPSYYTWVTNRNDDLFIIDPDTNYFYKINVNNGEINKLFRNYGPFDLNAAGTKFTYLASTSHDYYNKISIYNVGSNSTTILVFNSQLPVSGEVFFKNVKWATDGNKIIFITKQSNSNVSLTGEVSITSGEVTMISSAFASHLENVSPAGDKIVYASGENLFLADYTPNVSPSGGKNLTASISDEAWGIRIPKIE